MMGLTEADSGFTPESYLQTQVKVLQSLALRKRVLAKLKKAAENRPYIVPDRFDKWRSLFRVSAASAEPDAAPLPKVETRIRILDNSRIVEIVGSSADPRLAADFADGLAAEYIDYNLEALWQTAQRTSDWLTRQLDGLRNKLEESENQLQAYTRDSGLVFTGTDQNIDDEQLRQIQKQLSDAQADRIAKESAYEVASTTPVEALPQVLDNGRLADYQSKLSDLRRTLAELSSVYTPAYYKVAQVQAQINELEGDAAPRTGQHHEPHPERVPRGIAPGTAALGRLFVATAEGLRTGPQGHLLQHSEAGGGHEPAGLRPTAAEDQADRHRVGAADQQCADRGCGGDSQAAFEARSAAQQPRRTRLRPGAGLGLRVRGRVHQPQPARAGRSAGPSARAGAGRDPVAELGFRADPAAERDLA